MLVRLSGGPFLLAFEIDFQAEKDCLRQHFIERQGIHEK